MVASRKTAIVIRWAMSAQPQSKKDTRHELSKFAQEEVQLGLQSEYKGTGRLRQIYMMDHGDRVSIIPNGPIGKPQKEYW